jgi:glycosyltransferase involved in cell wall biosynthesis
MIPPRMDQVLAGFAEGDAISLEARRIRSIAQGLGMESDIFVPADRVAREVRDMCRPLDAYCGRVGDAVLYHYSIASPASVVVTASPARKLMRYHNITPAEFFEPYDASVAEQLRDARSGLCDAALATECVWADSEYNAGDVRELGHQNVKVAPLFFTLDDFATVPVHGFTAKFGGPLKNILFVGRIAPNKCVEELILAFAWYNHAIEPASRLILVGSEYSCVRYYAFLRMLAARLELPNVCFEGYLSTAAVAACYEKADLFVCTSRHEGYCLPLVEAMNHGVPVIARNAGGMPEAMGGAGMLFEDAEPRVLAELMHRALTDQTLRGEMLGSQERRLAALRGRDLKAELRALLES